MKELQNDMVKDAKSSDGILGLVLKDKQEIKL